STPQVRLMNTTLIGKAQDNILSTDLQVKDSEEKVHYRISGELLSERSDFTFSLRQDGLILNYEPWAVNGGNKIRFGGRGIETTDLLLSNKDQKLSVNTAPP